MGPQVAADGIRDIGTLVPCDAEGYIVNIASTQYLKPPWDAPVLAVVERCQLYFGHRLVALYLRGSLAYGTAIVGMSDLDMFVIVADALTEDDQTWGDQLKIEITHTFPYLVGADFDLVPLSRTENTAVRLVLKTQTIFLWGRDLTVDYPKFKISHWAAQHVYLLGHQLGDVLTALFQEQDQQAIAATCAWICKRIVRAGFELVMEREQAYTRDLYPAYQTFSKYYPEQKPQMYHALQLAVFPTTDRAALVAFLAGFGAWLVVELDAKFAVHLEGPPPRKLDQDACAAPMSVQQASVMLRPETILQHHPQHRLTLRFGEEQGVSTLFFRCGVIELGCSPEILEFLLMLQVHPQFIARDAIAWRVGLSWEMIQPFLEVLMMRGFLLPASHRVLRIDHASTS